MAIDRPLVKSIEWDRPSSSTVIFIDWIHLSGVRRIRNEPERLLDRSARRFSNQYPFDATFVTLDYNIP